MRIDFLWIYVLLTGLGFLSYYGWRKAWVAPFVIGSMLMFSVPSHVVWLLGWTLIAISGVLLAWTTVKENQGRENEVTRIVLQFLLGAILVVLLKNEDLKNYPVIIVVVTGFIFLLSSMGLELAHTDYPLYSFVTRGVPLLVWVHKLQAIQNIFVEDHFRTILVLFSVFQSLYVVQEIFRRLPDFSTLKRETLLTRQIYALTLLCFAFGPTETVWILIVSLWIVILLLSELPKNFLLVILTLPVFLPSFVTQVALSAVLEDPMRLACVGFTVLVFQVTVIFNLFNPKRSDPPLRWRSGSVLLLWVAGVYLNRWTLGVLPESMDEAPWISMDHLSELNHFSNPQVFGMSSVLFAISGLIVFLLVKFIKNAKKKSSQVLFSSFKKDAKKYFVQADEGLTRFSYFIFPGAMNFLAEKIGKWTEYLNRPLSYFSNGVGQLKSPPLLRELNISILDKWNISLIVYLLMGLWFSSLG